MESRRDWMYASILAVILVGGLVFLVIANGFLLGLAAFGAGMLILVVMFGIGLVGLLPTDPPREE